MPEDEIDPIKIEYPQMFDRRLASFQLRSENAPRDPEHAISLSGSVQFGERSQLGASGRSYIISIRAAFLDIIEMNAQFRPNIKLQDQLQEASHQQVETRGTKSEWGVGGSGNADLSADVLNPHAQAKASGKFSAGRHSKRELSSKKKAELFRTQWQSGGMQIGIPGIGDPGSFDGALKGRFAEGEWGTLEPNRGVKQYGCMISLVLRRGNLRVEREEPTLIERIGMVHENERHDAFDGLKTSIASWVVEDALRKSLLDTGFAKDRGEVVLAYARLVVDLENFPPKAEQLAIPSEICDAAPFIDTAKLPAAAVSKSENTSQKKRARPPRTKG